ncbi:MAG: hypothetical protein ACE5JL_17565 [Dehalococcoidia bacterium]
MAIMQLSIVTPREGNGAKIENLLQALDALFAQAKGYVLGLRFSGMGNAQELGRIFVWESQEAAEEAVGSREASVILSRLKELAEADPLEQSYELQGYALKPR